VMSLLYLTAGTVWIILWAMAQKHSHKIHIVIGSVAVAGFAFLFISVSSYQPAFHFLDGFRLNLLGGIREISRSGCNFQIVVFSE